MKDEYTTKDIILALDIRRQKLRGWRDDVPGFMKPSLQESGGQGLKAIYSYNDLLSLALFKHLIEIGKINRETAAFLVKIIRKNLPRGLTLDDIDFIFAPVRDDSAGTWGVTIVPKPIFSTKDKVFELDLSDLGNSESWDIAFAINMRKIKAGIIE